MAAVCRLRERCAPRTMLLPRYPMNHWLAENVPAFAVVGRVNMGKSAVLSTLLEIDDNATIRVSHTPGETTEVQPLPLILDGQERMRFLDTPGFSRAVDAMKRIQSMAGERTPTLHDIAKFSLECHAEFPDECRLLQPLVEGAGILYIVDPCKPLRDAFLAEMEILRWSGRPRQRCRRARVGKPALDGH